LVNDIDCHLVTPDGETYLPWVLNSEPDPLLLALPATRGIDKLNNMEQVLIENPQEGNYNFILDGTVIPFGDHKYYVTWEVVTDEISMIYPIGGEKLLPAYKEIAFWEALPNGEGYTLSISTDDGNTWEELAAVNPNTTTAELTLPDVLTDQAKIKVTRGAQESISERFTIAPVPEDLKIEEVRVFDMTFSWDLIAGAVSYDVWSLGNKYMEYNTTTTETSITMPIDNPYKEQWFAVSANFPNDIKSRRSIAINSDGSGLFNFMLDYDLRLTNISEPSYPNFINCKGPFEDNLTVEVANSGIFPLENINICFKLNDLPEVCELYTETVNSLDTLSYTFTTPYFITENGVFEIESWVTYPNRTLVFDDTTFVSAPVYIDDGLTIPFQERFSSNSLPEFWYSESPEDTRTWSVLVTDQKNGQEGSVLILPFANYNGNSNSNGQEDYAYMIPLNLSEASGTIVLDFDLAYFYVGQEDGLRIEVSTDCGNTFQDIIYEKFGRDLSTSFTPFNRPEDRTNWGREELDISQYGGFDKVQIRFVGINDSGNNLFVDNIKVTQKTTTTPRAFFSLDDAEACTLKPLIILENSSLWLSNSGKVVNVFLSIASTNVSVTLKSCRYTLSE